jgi:hypothetical protein
MDAPCSSGSQKVNMRKISLLMFCSVIMCYLPYRPYHKRCRWVVKLMVPIWGVPASNLKQDTSYPEVSHNLFHSNIISGARGSVVGQGTCRKVAGSIPDDVIRFFQFIELFQPHYSPGVDSASNRNEYQECSWEDKERPESKADNLTVICEPIIYKMWAPRRLTTRWVFMAFYRKRFLFFAVLVSSGRVPFIKPRSLPSTVFQFIIHCYCLTLYTQRYWKFPIINTFHL